MNQWQLIGIGIFVAVVGIGIGFQMGRQVVSPGLVMPSPAQHAYMTMDHMTAVLQGKTGDEFDKAFIELMIVHHEGAVAMAKLIPTQAKHAELKQMGQAIISAQSKEIDVIARVAKSVGVYEAINQRARWPSFVI
jgi:uncharacterized protein (DUF305 family)